MVLLDGAGDPEQRLVAAVGLHPVPAPRAHGHARLREVAVLASEGLTLIGGEPLKLLHRPRLAAPVLHATARTRGELCPLGAPAGHAAGAWAPQVLEVRLRTEPPHDPSRA